MILHHNRYPSDFKGLKNPVEMVSWDDCQEFVEKLNAKVGVGKFSLPTEAQWEYACRAGSTTRYCFGDDESGLGEYAWYAANSKSKTHLLGETHPVGEKKPNAFGLYDMHGNVWEWCQDWYDGDYYANSPTDDPAGPVTGSDRVYRGSCWIIPARCCRSSATLFRSEEPPHCGQSWAACNREVPRSNRLVDNSKAVNRMVGALVRIGKGISVAFRSAKESGLRRDNPA